MAVNRKMWADIGVTDPPQTWEAFIAGLRALKARGYQPLACGGRGWSAAMPLTGAIQTDLYDHQIDPAKPSWTKRRNEGSVRFATDPTVRLILQNMIGLLGEFTRSSTTNGTVPGRGTDVATASCPAAPRVGIGTVVRARAADLWRVPGAAGPAGVCLQFHRLDRLEQPEAVHWPGQLPRTVRRRVVLRRAAADAVGDGVVCAVLQSWRDGAGRVAGSAPPAQGADPGAVFLSICAEHPGWRPDLPVAGQLPRRRAELDPAAIRSRELDPGMARAGVGALVPVRVRCLVGAGVLHDAVPG